MTHKKYLESKGWMNVYDNKWVDLTLRCSYECHEDIALEVQEKRDWQELPWYKKFMRKLANGF